MNAREHIIPSGACIGTEAELFVELDSGGAADDALQAGKLACETCLQNPICQANGTEIGGELYMLTGNSNMFVGGRNVATPTDALRSKVIEPAIRFNLSELPPDPGLALQFIRRAVRSRLFLPVAHMPSSAVHLADKFMHDAAQADPSLYARLLAPPHMDRARAHRGLQHVAVTLFQQADYNNVAINKKNKQRYDPVHIDPQTHYDISRRFAEDMLTLDERNFLLPERQALVHSPEEYAKLMEKYLDATNICLSDFHYVLKHSINDPEQELRNRWARLHILRETQGEDVPESILRERARWQLKPEKATIALQRPRFNDHRLDAKAVEAIYEAVDNGQPSPQPDEQTTQTVLALREKFGTDPTLGLPANIGRFAHLPAEEAIAICENIQKQIAAALQARSQHPDTSVTEKFVRKYVVKSGFETFEKIESAYITDRLHTRFQQRARNVGIKNNVPRWAIGRACALHEKDDIEGVAETLYTFCNDRQLLVEGMSEMSLLQDVTYKADIHAICDPYTGRYITFSPSLHQLLPQERLAFACGTGLSRLLYGVDIDPAQVAALVDVDNFRSYFVEEVLPTCENLAVLPPVDGALPTLLRRLSDDLLILDVAQRQAEHYAGPVPSITTILGGTALELGPGAIDIQAESGELTAWLQQTIFDRCRPNHLEVAADVQRALQQGVLEIVGNAKTGYNVIFSEYLRSADKHGVAPDEQQIAALAHCLGIDQLMYGYDIGELLENRLEIGIIETAQPLMERIRQHQTAPKAPPQAEQPQRVPEYPDTTTQLLKTVFGRDTNTELLSQHETRAIIHELQTIFDTYIKWPSHQKKIAGNEIAVFLAWQDLLEKSAESAGEALNLAPREIEKQVAVGLRCISQQLLHMSVGHVWKTVRSLTAPTADASRMVPPQTLMPKPQPQQPQPKPTKPTLYDYTKTAPLPDEATAASKREWNTACMRIVEAGLYADHLLENLAALPPDKQQLVDLHGAENIEQFAAELRTIVREGRAAEELLLAKVDPLLQGLAGNWVTRSGKAMPYNDLLQLARLAAVKSLNSHDYRKATFKTYAYRAATNDIIEELASSYDIRIPRTTLQLMSKIFDIKKNFAAKGETPDEATIAEKAGISIERYREVTKIQPPVQVEYTHIMDTLVYGSSVPTDAGETGHEAVEALSRNQLIELARHIILTETAGQEIGERRFQMFTYHLAGLDYPAIAERMDVPIGTVKSGINRAMSLLRKSDEFKKLLRELG